MNDTAFLVRVHDHLVHSVPDDVVVTAVRPSGGRPWPRTEVTFVLAHPPSSWHGPTRGSAFLPLAEEWRQANAYEEPSEYARLLADEVESAALRLVSPRPPLSPPTPLQVRERWQWLLQRLALNGPVQQVGEGRLLVTTEKGTSFTVLVTPEEWARIATPLDPDADDPQDFNQLSTEAAYLVFYEDDLVWSTRPELPPVTWGARLRREFLAARARGQTNIGWFAGRHPTAPDTFDADAE